MFSSATRASKPQFATAITLLQGAYQTDKFVTLRGHWARSGLKEFVFGKLYTASHFICKIVQAW
jgi:hypothetical protein